jgi:hypothetical protein
MWFVKQCSGWERCRDAGSGSCCGASRTGRRTGGGPYAFAAARQRQVVRLAHITNTLATEGDDFEKGVDNGVHDALAVARAAAIAMR